MRCDKYGQVCHLMENCDDHGGGAWGGVTVVRECDSHQGGVKGIEMFYGEVLWQCGRCKWVWRGVTAFSTFRDDLTCIVSVSLRKYDIFS